MKYGRASSNVRTVAPWTWKSRSLKLPLEHDEVSLQGSRGFLEDVCSAGIIPVIPSVAVDASGQKLNVNADTAAAAIARILKSEKLVFVSDVPGIFLDRHNPATLQSHLTAVRCRELIRDGIIDAGMVPKVEAALEALVAGVGKVHVVDGRRPHSVLLEIYSDTGVGTEIVL